MNLIRCQFPTAAVPFARFQTVADEMTRLFDFPFFGRLPGAPVSWTPAFDLAEDQDAVTVRAELPGLKKDQIQINLQDDTLTITGERKFEGEGQNHIRRERGFGRFERSIRLNTPIDETGAKATFEDGVLTLVLPKAPEAKPRQIAIS
ncbi:MAG: Hsp20/alpha crystallin family protein [Verrucomicrobia bacterium]|nr:Hsp20/alpha crystallin family protein [Verrucomicrobiota bacterium]